MRSLADERKEWLKILSGKDRHAIVRQLTQMTWDAAAFRVVNEARRLAPPDPDGGVQLNGLMHSLLDRAFFASHMAAVRRLTDKYSLEGSRGVCSMSALLADMLRNRELFTREAIFAAEGLEYDYEPMRQKCFEYARQREAAGERAYWVPPELQWHKHENRHKQVDRLAGIRPQGRRPEDTVRECVFVNLQQKVEGACQTVVEHVNKFIAHAATPESRATVGADEAGLTLNHLWQGHQHLCEVAGFVAGYVLGDACPGFLAIPQFDQFQYIERPIIASSQVDRLQALWRDFEQECHDWSQWGIDEYEAEFGGTP